MLGTISWSDVCWTGLCCWSAWHHARIWWAVRRDIEDLEAGLLPVTADAMTLFRSDAGSEADWALLWSALAMVGVVAMTQPSRPLDAQAAIVVVLLFGVAIWSRVRSEIRGRKRARIINRHERGR